MTPDAGGRQFRQQVLRRPSAKCTGIDVAFKKPGSQKKFSNQGADHVYAASGVPVVRAVTTFSNRGVAMRSGRVVCEAAFVNVAALFFSQACPFYFRK